MSNRDKNGRFVKGNAARTVHKQKQLKSKAILDELEELQASIYIESLRQIKDKLESGEINANELIRINSSVAEQVSVKKEKRPTKAKANKMLGDLDALKELLGEI